MKSGSAVQPQGVAARHAWGVAHSNSNAGHGLEILDQLSLDQLITKQKTNKITTVATKINVKRAS